MMIKSFSTKFAKNWFYHLTRKSRSARLFTVQEVAKFLDKDDKTIYYHIRVGNLEVDRRYGKSLIKESSLNEFIKK